MSNSLLTNCKQTYNISRYKPEQNKTNKRK